MAGTNVGPLRVDTVVQVVAGTKVGPLRLDTVVQVTAGTNVGPRRLDTVVQVTTGTNVSPLRLDVVVHAVNVVHVVIGTHVVTALQTETVEVPHGGWGGQTLQSVVVVADVVVVQLVEQGTVEVMSTVTVPTTYREVHVVQDCCGSCAVADGVQRPLLLWADVYG